MRRVIVRATLIIAVCLVGHRASAQDDIQLANGIVIKGEAAGTDGEGLNVRTASGTKNYTWDTLSNATRYRYDPSFRANYDAILKGLPPYARTNQPDEEVKGVPVFTPVETDETRDKPPARKEKPKSLMIFDQADYETVDPLYSSSFPNVNLKNPELTTYIGFQYGPGQGDVVYLAFDTESKSDLSDTLYVYGPGTDAYKKPERMTGFKKGTGASRYVNFKKFDVSSHYGVIKTEYDFDCESTGKLTNSMTLTVSATLSHEDEKSRFMLHREYADLLQGEGLIIVEGLLDLPVLWVGLEMTPDGPRLVGNLNMSNMKMVPKDGMDSRVRIELVDSNGKVVDDGAVKLDTDSFSDEYGIIYDLKRADSGETYTIRASIDLGPFLGSTEFEDEITIP